MRIGLIGLCRQLLEIALLLCLFGEKAGVHPGCYGNLGQIGRALP